MEISLFMQLITSIGLGALIGLERDISNKSNSQQFGGIRTFALISLSGTIAILIDSFLTLNKIFTFGTFVIISIFILVSHIYSTFKKREIGITSELSAILTYLIGIIIGLGYNNYAIIITILITLIISLKAPVKEFTKGISKDEFMHSMKFAVIAFVILPILPDTKYSFNNILGSIGIDTQSMVHPIMSMSFFNPHSIWFFVVVISAVGYVGYILSKFFGKNSSIILSSIVGGLVSSTAVTATMSEQSKKDPSNPFIYTIGVLFANSVMLIRVVIIVLLFNITLLESIWLPATFMLIGFLIFIGYSYIKSKNQIKNTHISSEDKMESPFSIIPALKFGGFIIMIKFIAAIGLLYKDTFGGEYFYYILGMISGFADVDAITQTMTLQAKEDSIAGGIAISTIIIAVMSNNIVKGSIALKFGDIKFGKIVMSAFGLSIILGITGIIINSF